MSHPATLAVRTPVEAELRLAPGPRVRLLAQEVGRRPVSAWCAAVLGGADPGDGVLWVGGRHAAARIEEPWPRVWAARALLYVWDDLACDAVVAALEDEAWRVREMAAKVVRLRELPGAHLLPALLRDPLPRVRVAGLRALAAVGESEHADAVVEAVDDDEADVARAAIRAVGELEKRLDRRFLL